MPVVATARYPLPPPQLRSATRLCASGETQGVRASERGRGGVAAQNGAEPRAEGALTLARQVGGGGAVLLAAAGRRGWGPFKRPPTLAGGGRRGPEGGGGGRELLEGLRPALKTPQREDAVRAAWLEPWSHGWQGPSAVPRGGARPQAPEVVPSPKKPATEVGGGASSWPLPGLQRGCPSAVVGLLP